MWATYSSARLPRDFLGHFLSRQAMRACRAWEAEAASKLLPSVGAIRSSEEEALPGNTLEGPAVVWLFSESGVAKEITLDEFVERGPADDDADVWLAFALYVS